MQITRLSCQSSVNNEPTSWQLREATSNLQGIVSLHVTEIEGSKIQNLFSFLFSDEDDKSLYSGALEIIDNDGNRWSLTKKTGRSLQIKKNKALVTESIADTVLGALLDFDLLGSRDINQSKDLFPVFAVHGKNGELTISDASEAADSNGISEVQIQKARMDVAQDCSNLFSQPKLCDVKIIPALTNRIEPLYYQITELWRQKRSLDSVIEQRGSLEQLQSLEDLVANMNEMQDCCLPLVDPSKSPQVLTRRLQGIETKEMALKGPKAPMLPDIDNQTPWTQLFSERAQLDALSHLAKAVSTAARIEREHIDQVFQQGTGTIQCLLSRSKDLTEELETALGQVKDKISYIENEQKSLQQNKLRGKIGAFLKPRSAVELDRHGDVSTENVDSLRTTIDFVLGKIGELFAQLKTGQNEFEKHRENIPQKLEELLKKHGRARKAWQKSCQAYRIDESTTCASLVTLMNQTSDFLTLSREKNEIKAELVQRQVRIKKLQKLITEYRHAIGSQKEVNLATPELVISEAQSVLRYKKHRQEQLGKLKSKSLEIKVSDAQLQSLHKRIQLLMSSWKDAFIQLGLNNIAVNNHNWITFFQKSRIIQALSEIKLSGTERHQLEQVLSNGTWDTPITLLTVPENLNAEDFDVFIQALKKRNNAGLIIIIHSSRALNLKLRRQGADEFSPEVMEESKEVIAPKRTTSNEDQQRGSIPDSRSTKVERVLSLFENARSKHLNRGL
jgi:hypothetical protein